MPKKYFVFDTSSLIFKYACQNTSESKRIRTRVNKPFAAFAADRRNISLQIPSICMAECSGVFAKLCFEDNAYGNSESQKVEAYRNLQSALLADVKTDRILCSYEVKRKHYIDIEEIFIDDYNLGSLRGNTSRLSGHDALIIAVARDIGLNVANGLDKVVLITADTRMADVCNGHKDKYPRAINIRHQNVNA